MPPSCPSVLAKSFSEGLQVYQYSRAACREFFINASRLPGESPATFFARVAAALRDANPNATIISQEVFGLESGEAACAAMEGAFGEVSWPVLWLVDGADSPYGGTQLWAIDGLEVQTLEADGRVIASVFEDEGARWCRIGGVLPEPGASREEQALAAFELMEDTLKRIDMDFHNVVRTWIYNDTLLDWYGPFNKVRDDFFKARGIFDGLVPASTGISGRNPRGSATAMGLLALQPKTGDVRAFAVTSPLQCPALHYGSSFSRAVEIEYPDHRRLYVSGTASIEPEGATLYVGDCDGQVGLTMEVVEAILESRNMSWSDVTRKLAYFHLAADAPIYARYCIDHKLPEMPVLVTNNTICRHDLLFEIEIDAIVPRTE